MDPPWGSIEYRFAPWTGRDLLDDPEFSPDGTVLYPGFGMTSLHHDNGERLTWAYVAIEVKPNWEQGVFLLDVDLSGTGSEGFGLQADITLRPVPEPSALVMLGVALMGLNFRPVHRGYTSRTRAEYRRMRYRTHKS